MHLPAGTHYLCVCSNDAHLIDFYAAADSIFENFGIKIIMQPISIESCVNLVKAEHDRNFIIIVMLDSFILRSKTITKFNELFAQSPCNHKLGLIDVREDIRMQIYYTLVGSLNLALAFTVDGILKTFGILVDQNNSEIKSSLVSSNYEPIPIEIINIKPIILDMERCGVLEPILYFVARDIGTCIAQVLLPGSTTWSVAYLIQCDDSGRNDHDMVKVCLINEKSTEKDVSVLNNSNYPLCRAISGLLYDLKHLPASLDVVTPLIKTVSDALTFATADNPEIFPDATEILQVKKKYSKLFSEITQQLLTIKDHRQEQLAGIIKQLRRMINFLNHDVNLQTKKAVIKTKWFDVVQSYADPDSRCFTETMKLKKKRLESEQKDGIVTMPLLEPYLEIKWPNALPVIRENYPHAVLHEYAEAMAIAEQDLLLNKRFGV